MGSSRKCIYEDFSQVKHADLRLKAVVKRLMESKDAPKMCSLFAWGRMTITIKDAQGTTVELWKPKRCDIIAVFAYVHMHWRTLFQSLPGYIYLYEDASRLHQIFTTKLTAPEDSFVLIQEDLDRYWGVHKRNLCPALRRQRAPGAMMHPMSTQMSEYAPVSCQPSFEYGVNPFEALEVLATSVLAAAKMSVVAHEKSPVAPALLNKPQTTAPVNIRPHQYLVPTTAQAASQPPVGASLKIKSSIAPTPVYHPYKIPIQPRVIAAAPVQSAIPDIAQQMKEPLAVGGGCWRPWHM